MHFTVHYSSVIISTFYVFRSAVQIVCHLRAKPVAMLGLLPSAPVWTTTYTTIPVILQMFDIQNNHSASSLTLISASLPSILPTSLQFRSWTPTSFLLPTINKYYTQPCPSIMTIWPSHVWTDLNFPTRNLTLQAPLGYLFSCGTTLVQQGHIFYSFILPLLPYANWPL